MNYEQKCIAFYEKFQEYNKWNAKKYYDKHKDDPEFKEKLKKRNKSYYQRNREKVIERSKARNMRVRYEKTKDDK